MPRTITIDDIMPLPPTLGYVLKDRPFVELPYRIYDYGAGSYPVLEPLWTSQAIGWQQIIGDGASILGMASSTIALGYQIDIDPQRRVFGTPWFTLGSLPTYNFKMSLILGSKIKSDKWNGILSTDNARQGFLNSGFLSDDDLKTVGTDFAERAVATYFFPAASTDARPQTAITKVRALIADPANNTKYSECELARQAAGLASMEMLRAARVQQDAGHPTQQAAYLAAAWAAYSAAACSRSRVEPGVPSLTFTRGFWPQTARVAQKMAVKAASYLGTNQISIEQAWQIGHLRDYLSVHGL